MNEVGFKLEKVTTEQFATIDANYCETGAIKLQANFRFGADIVKHLIAVFANFTFECDGKPFMIVEGGCHFSIKPDSWEELYNQAENKLTAPKGMIQHLAVITVGTTRGILHTKTENSPFNRYILPTVNVANIITDDKIFEFHENNTGA